MRLEGTRVPLVTESERNDNEANVEDQHDHAHALGHLPVEGDNGLKTKI